MLIFVSCCFLYYSRLINLTWMIVQKEMDGGRSSQVIVDAFEAMTHVMVQANLALQTI